MLTYHLFKLLFPTWNFNTGNQKAFIDFFHFVVLLKILEILKVDSLKEDEIQICYCSSNGGTESDDFEPVIISKHGLDLEMIGTVMDKCLKENVPWS